MWKAGPFSAYGWASIIAGLFCILLALIFSSLTSVMPRSGGDYVFTSRILHPALGWMESWTLVIASVLIIAFEVPLVLRNLQITARIIGIGAGGLQRRQRLVHRRHRRHHRDPGLHRVRRGAAGHRAICVLPTRTFHRVVTALAGFGVACFIAMFVFGLLFTHKGSFIHNLPRLDGGVTSAKIAATGAAAGVLGAPPQSFLARIFSTGAFPIVLSVLLFQFIGFQYSAYIAGEVRGNVRRGVLIALLGALLIGVLANSVYVDAISSHFGFDTNVAWGAGYWGWAHSISPLPLGQPNAMPLLAVVANSSLWPLWALISLGGVVFPFLLCPVYINFISRMQLAWSLDRQMPEWFGRVNERLRAPLNAILATLALTAAVPVLPELQGPADVPGHDRPQAQPGRHGLVLDRDGAASPGACRAFNAILVRWRRPDLVRNAPFGKKLPWIGLAWLVFPLWIYVFAVIKPIVNALKAGGALTYLETNGIIDAACFYLIGLIIFFIMRYRARAAGVDEKMLFTELPPD